jgi:hypothetical protein
VTGSAGGGGGVVGALGYLIGRTIWNRIARQIARVRTPRYAIAFVVGGLYLWFFLLRRTGGGPSPSPAAIASTIGGLTSIGLAITVAVWWLGKGPSTALAFPPAEVHFLFTGPVSRRTVLAYRLVRSQIVLLLNALVMSFLIRRWGIVLAAPLRMATAWGFFTILSLHRLGAALVATTPVRGGSGRRIGRLLARTLSLGVIGALLISAGPALRRVGDIGFTEGLRLLSAALASPPASYAMAPFRLVVAPSFAASTSEWAQAFLPVLGLIVLHVLWVLSMRIEFEEEAATASAEVEKRRAAFRERRAGGASMLKPTRVTREWLPLGPTGLPAVAIAWKNTIGLARTGAMRSAIIFIVIALVASRVMSTGEGKSGAAIASPYLMFGLMLVILGPRIVRNDLRQDLLYLPLLKSYPLRGADVVAAEMASGAIVLTGLQIALGLIAWFAVPPSTHEALGSARAMAIFAVGPFALLALNLTGMMVQNAAALLFPGWVRLGADAGGVEATGQNLLVAFGSMFALLLTLVLPVLIGLATAFAVRGVAGDLALTAGGTAAVAVLVVEIVLSVRALGQLFERTDASSVAA